MGQIFLLKNLSIALSFRTQYVIITVLNMFLGDQNDR